MVSILSPGDRLPKVTYQEVALPPELYRVCTSTMCALEALYYACKHTYNKLFGQYSKFNIHFTFIEVHTAQPVGKYTQGRQIEAVQSLKGFMNVMESRTS